MCALQFVWNLDAHETKMPSALRYPSIFVLEIPVLPLKGIFEYSDYNFDMYFDSIIIIIIIIISSSSSSSSSSSIVEFLTSQLWLGNIHLSWDVVINRIGLGGLICNLKSSYN